MPRFAKIRGPMRVVGRASPSRLIRLGFGQTGNLNCRVGRKLRLMSKEAPRRRGNASKALSAEEQLSAAREIVRREGAGVWKVSYPLDPSFCEAVKLLYTCKVSAIVTGMGKAGIIGQKIAATLSSTGTRAHFVHPGEAFHGDLGRISPDDVVVMLTQSGETA